MAEAEARFGGVRRFIKRLGLLVVSVGVLLFSTHVLVQALQTHALPIPVRTGLHGTATLAGSPGLFWCSVAVYAVFAFFSLIGAMFALYELVAGKEFV